MMNAKIILLLLFGFFYKTVVAQQNTLQFFLAAAQKSSPLIKQLNNSNKIIDFDLAQFNAIYRSPKISVNSSVLFAPIISKDGGTNKLELTSSGSNNYIGYDLGATNGGQYQALLSVNQPLFTNQNYSAQKDKAQILKTQNNNRILLTNASLKLSVTHQYILCILAQKQQENNRLTIEIIKEQIVQMKPLINAGVYKLIDLKLLEIELKNSQVENERLKGEYLSNFNALNLICGIDNPTISKLEDIDLALQNPIKTSSLFVSQFKLDSLSVKTEQKIIGLNYLPQVALFGDAGLNATYLPKPNRLGFSVGVSLKWSLFDGHQKENSHQQSLVQLDNIAIDRNYFENQNKLRKKQIISQLNNLDQQLILIESQLAAYNKLLQLYKAEIKQSLVSVLEFKTLIKEISVKQQAKTTVLMTKEILINSYNYWNQ